MFIVVAAAIEFQARENSVSNSPLLSVSFVKIETP